MAASTRSLQQFFCNVYSPVNRLYDPKKDIDSSEFKTFAPDEFPEKNPKQNLAAFTNPNNDLHLVQRPVPKPGPGQVVVHVRATGICG